MSQHPTRFQALAADAKTRITEISAAEAANRQQTGVVVIDVREDKEFAQQHIADAVHLSRGILETQIEQVAPDPATPIICYCGGGNRSALAVDNLQKMGYTNVVSLAGGFGAWRAADLPTSEEES
ncbi:MAG: rhodanese-like domain-containing protein [Chloroflexi bacterium]|nr:rhodanese-like domain-containing protein [Chloroflexota bacterium]